MRPKAPQRAGEEVRRASSYPLARWYLRPLAGRLAALLCGTRVRPWHLTICGLLAAAAAGLVLVAQPGASPLAAALVLLAWFFDRSDGQLARRQQTVSPKGAWLDANVDELVDLGLHVATAAAASRLAASVWPWTWLIAFLVGKYLLMYGLAVDEPPEGGKNLTGDPARGAAAVSGRLRWAYHLPGNADVRVHLLALALATGWLTAELAVVAVYYNLRWVARWALVARRPGRTCQGGARP